MAGRDMFEVRAEAYDRFVGRYSPQLAVALCDFAGIENGRRALDVGAGPGALTAELAKRAGAANVVAVEPSEQFAHACRARVPGVEVVEAGAEALPLPNDAFDATLSQLVLNFLADAHAALREMTRVTRPGGLIAACVWDYSGEMEMLRAFWDSAHEVSPAAAAQHDEATMRLGREGELGQLWQDAGLLRIRSTPLRVRGRYANFDDLWASFLGGVGPAGAFTVSLDEHDRAALRAALARRLGGDDQPFELSARAWAVAGTVP
jgi:SAM-dependent methyltransferase